MGGVFSRDLDSQKIAFRSKGGLGLQEQSFSAANLDFQRVVIAEQRLAIDNRRQRFWIQQMRREVE